MALDPRQGDPSGSSAPNPPVGDPPGPGYWWDPVYGRWNPPTVKPGPTDPGNPNADPYIPPPPAPDTTTPPPPPTAGPTPRSPGPGFGSLIAPFPDQAPTPTPSPTFSGLNYPNIPAFSYPGFTPPTGEDILKEPGYQFRLDQGEQALTNNRAAGGLLDSGSTLKDILGYGQNYASSEYQNAWQRDLGAYQTNYGAALSNYSTNLQSQYALPYAAANQRAQDIYNSQNTAHQFDFNALNNQFLEKYSQYRNQQNDVFNKLYSVGQLGLNSNT
jgi:hypothetical protein